MPSYHFSSRILFFIVMVSGSCLFGHADAEDGSLNLTLKQAITMAVEKNLDVKAELYNSAMAEADIRKNSGMYDPLLSFLVNYENSTTQLPSIFLAGTPLSREKILQINPGINQLIPSGGALGLVFDNTWNQNNSSPERGFLNDYWQSQLALTFTQPLLKNFGRETTELNISVAKYNKEGALDQFKTKLIDTIAQVRTQYFQLNSLREDLEVKKTSLMLAEKILNDTRAQVKAGVLPAMEILNAQFGVASMQKNLIDAERAVKDQVDSLQVLLQLPAGGDIVPVDKPLRDEYAVDEAASIRKALTERSDLKQLLTTLKATELQSRVAGHQTLPDLSFIASAALTGLGKSYSRDTDKVVSGDYPIWAVGLQFSYPLGNQTAENEYIKSKLRIGQTQTQVKSLEDTIANEVRNAVRALKSSYKQLDVTTRGSAYAEERLHAYIKKNQVGLATAKDVLDVENDLVTAKGNQIRALADYNNAITALWKASGELLEREGITLNQKDADSLYEKSRD
ncbi:MAG: outer rane efflux protein [Geobacteraceae bacterium]|nr:outer rane efflux protein [Geobacteraceae bacterium]